MTVWELCDLVYSNALSLAHLVRSVKLASEMIKLKTDGPGDTLSSPSHPKRKANLMTEITKDDDIPEPAWPQGFSDGLYSPSLTPDKEEDTQEQEPNEAESDRLDNATHAPASAFMPDEGSLTAGHYALFLDGASTAIDRLLHQWIQNHPTGPTEWDFALHTQLRKLAASCRALSGGH